MGILLHESQYPSNKNKEVVAAWFRAVEKYPKPEGLFTTLIDTAARPTKQGFKILSAYLVSPGKYESALRYWSKFMTEFWDIEDYYFEFTHYATIEEALKLTDQESPKR